MSFEYFTLEEFDCQETGKNNMDEDFLHKLDELREACGFPFKITSGYRDITHSVEVRKAKGGTHTKGIAADIKVTNGADRYTILKNALAMGFTGIGVANTFIHVDTREGTPVIWSY